MSKGFLMKAERNIPLGIPTLDKNGFLKPEQIRQIVPVWTNLTLLNSWTNKTGQICQYRKYPNGIVEVKFWLVKPTLPTLGEALFNLPALHRPSTDYQFSAVMTDSKKAYILGHLQVGADGNVGFYSNKMDVNTEVRGRLVFGVE